MNLSIEIIDKSGILKMAYTAMTIFNRSMINLDNEFGKLNSYDLNKNSFKAKVISDFSQLENQR